MTEVLKATTDADFLSMVPAVVGYHASNSVVFVAFTGKRTAGGFRLDLPGRRRTSEYKQLANAAISVLSRMPGVDRVAPVIYSDASFQAESGVPWLDFARLLADRLHTAGFGLTAELCVAPDGWANYFDRDYPRAGRPLVEISASPLSESPLMREVPDIADWSRLPDVASDDVDAFGALTQDLLAGVAVSELEMFDEFGMTEFIETVADWQRGDLPLPIAAMFLLVIRAPAHRDEAMLQIAFGREVGEEVGESNEHYLDIQASTGLTMDEVVMREIAAGRAEPDMLSGDLIMGEGTIRPDIDRVERNIRHLKRLVALTTSRQRLAPLCMIAWLQWSLGRGSAAGHFADHALRIDPHYGMAQVLYSLFASGQMPEWAFTSGAAQQ